MPKMVGIKGAKARRRVYRRVVSKTNVREHGAPSLGSSLRKRAQDVFNNAIGSFGLTIGLRMVSGGHI